MATMTRSGPSLRLKDFSDRELLALVKSQEDTEGWADSQDIALAIWPRQGSEPGPRASVSIRFSWMKRWELMERDEREPRKWRLTEWGQALVSGRLTATQRRAIEESSDAAMLHLGAALGQRYVDADESAAVLLRRSMQFAQHQRRGR